ncbi:uncharacterized protein [Diadema antillarum]|uniref:uncharacterized protein isoform X2 n=1 Tax=Diadema antillarum TaxID=105358 RepID=UPI003A892543
MASVAKGWRVVRGPDWKYEDQDGGKGHLGTIKDVPGGNQTGLVVVQWDYGYRGRYRIGADNAYDLLLWDNAPAGTKHKGVECNECSYHTKGGLAGVRWKCMDCPNYDLCTPCYLAGEHETNHAFWRYTSAEATGVQMPIRQGCEQQDVFGFFPKAEVARGPDWKYGDQDDGNDSRGRIKDLTEMNDVARSAATVIWSSKASFAEIPVVRVGYHGFVDLKRVATPVQGGKYYAGHLPIVGYEEGISVDDKVCITADKEAFDDLQEELGLDKDNSMISHFARVLKITNKGVKVKFKSGVKMVVNPMALEKVPMLKKDDEVRVCNDRKKARRLQEHHGGWNSSMSKVVGKKGTVVRVDKDGDVRVAFGSHKWTFNPCSLRRLIGKTHSESEEEVEEISEDSDEEGDDVVGSGDAARKHADLFHAVDEGDVETVRQIVESHRELVNTRRGGRMAIHSAAAKGQLDVVRVLVEEGQADLNVGDTKQNAVPLHYAAEAEAGVVMRYMLEHGADVDAVTKHNATALHVAIGNDNKACIAALLDFNPRFDILDANGETPLHRAVRKDSDFFEMLMASAKFDPRLKSKKGFNLLHYAAYHGEARSALALVGKYPDMVNEQFSDGHVALHIACVNNHRAVAEALLSVGNCEIDAKNRNGQTATAASLSGGKTACVELLLAEGTDVNIQENDGDTYLHLAARAYRDNDNMDSSPTLERICAKHRSSGVTGPAIAMICLLIMKGADITTKNKKGKTPLEYISNRKVREFVKKLAEDTKRGRGQKLSMVPEDEVPEEKQRPTTLSGGFAPGVRLIDKKDLTKRESIVGKGGFGKVYEGIWSRQKVAIKEISTKTSKLQEIKHEVETMAKAAHENIVRLYGVCYDEEMSHVDIVMQFIDGFNLREIIFKQCLQPPLTYGDKIKISTSLLQALVFLHSQGILHLDIKPGNIMLNRSRQPFLCDLGLASIKRASQTHFSALSLKGTYKYIPPEFVVSPRNPKSQKQDVWSLACTLLEMFVEKDLWENQFDDRKLLKRFVKEEKVSPIILELAQEDIKPILEPCFEKDPKRRPETGELLDQFEDLRKTIAVEPDDGGALKQFGTNTSGDGSSDPGYFSGGKSVKSEKITGSLEKSQEKSFSASSVGSSIGNPKKLGSADDIKQSSSTSISTGSSYSTGSSGEVLSVEGEKTSEKTSNQSSQDPNETAADKSPQKRSSSDDRTQEKNKNDQQSVNPSQGVENVNPTSPSATKDGNESPKSPTKNVDQNEPAESPSKESNLHGQTSQFTCSRTIDHLGGNIKLEGLDIVLNIPAGALPPGKPKQITVSLVPGEHGIQQAGDDELDAGPLVECLPSGLEFQKQVTLTIPHCAIISDIENAQGHLYYCDDDTSIEFSKMPCAADGSPTCVVRDNVFVLHLDHFTLYKVTVTGEGVEGKEIGVTSYLPKSRPTANSNAIITSYLHDNAKWIAMEIDEAMSEHGNTTAHPRRYYQLRKRYNGMNVHWSGGAKDKTIPYETLRRRSRYPCDFILRDIDNQQQFEMTAGQQSSEEKIEVIIDPRHVWRNKEIKERGTM